MAISDIIAIALIVAVIIAAIVYLIIKYNGKKSRVCSILKSHPFLTKVLLDCEKVHSISSITDEQSKKLLSLSDSDWEEWESLAKRVKNLADKYPQTLFEFIGESFPKCKDRVNYKSGIKLFMPIPQKVKIAVASLLLDELRQIDADSEEVWKQRDDLRIFATKIRQKYPEGYKTYCLVHKIRTPKDNEVVISKKHIAELQKLYDESKGYEGWEKKQDDFSSEYWQILKDVRSNDGRYVYNVHFNKPNRLGSYVDSEFKVWQGFCESFSSFLMDRQTDWLKSKYRKISEFRKRTRYFYDSVYDQIFEIISKFDEQVEKDLYVILIDKCKRNWSKLTYDYHYRRIREQLDDNEVKRIDFSALPSITDNGNVGGIFILDFITSNEELKSNCKLIIEHFNKSVPLIGYYSLIKEYDEEELLEIAKNNDGYLTSEENDIEFIKNCLLQVKKHSFFSYIAIPNTWIGEAGQAEQTKRTWLENPTMYDFKTKKEKGCISGEYSIDGGMNYEDISIEGDGFDIDDTAKFTYLLFKKMGVLARFKEEGHNAIEYMNEHDILTYH
ncbi:hypothetical protein CIK92_09165 [Prevotella sp. P4-67]|uniref:hypothetical protein n=1 Tax=Prevotella sp. P4-67 TaxID=2024227 RepID=UPI000B9661F8|nr:hypothetical protein [Prevotella sp. P4-67]OYP70643.1 hypothetical protein CIK92_09165 [Prevotella sp. P4-67]